MGIQVVSSLNGIDRCRRRYANDYGGDYACGGYNVQSPLASMTGGQGSYGIEFLRYDIVPGNVQQQIIASAKMVEDEE